MTKRKYHYFVNIVLILLCLFPLITYAIAVGSSDSLMSTDQILTHFSNSAISSDFAGSFIEILSSMGITISADEYGESITCGGIALVVIMSNSIVIYMCYILVEILLFVPKMAIKFLRMGSGKYD